MTGPADPAGLPAGGGLVPAGEEDFLSVWERRTGPVLIVAAIAPLAAGLAGRKAGGETLVLDLVSWLVFVVDYAVHLRFRRHFLRSRLGLFDLAIVVLTAPWYLIPGAAAGWTAATRLGRLGRLARVFVASTKSRKLRELVRRLGAAAAYSLALMVCCALAVRAVEPVESGFATFGDSMWWAMVTFTTVGYGDLYPVTAAGRAAGVLLMVGGIALIGSLAGTLGSFFGSGDAEPAAPEPAGSARATSESAGPDPAGSARASQSAWPATAAPLTEETAVQLLAELGRLRDEVAELRRTEPGRGPMS